MERYRPYAGEITLVLATMVVGVLGFWSVYVGSRAGAEPHHHFHVATTFGWMGLLFTQVLLLARGKWQLHRRVGLAVLVAGPLLVGSAAFLAMHSAQSAIASGQPDFLIVQNIVGTLWLGLILVLAFALRKQRKVHGAFLMSTLLIFLGPAIFFALIAFAPAYRIEGPETFYRFQTAGEMSLNVNLAIAFLMFVKDWRNGWPYLFTAGSGPLAVGLQAYLASVDQLDNLTIATAAPNRGAILAIVVLLVGVLLARTALPRRDGRPSFVVTEGG
ncbi:hypothetical protein ACWPM1_05240 [Tsuneonella sp. HG249]